METVGYNKWSMSKISMDISSSLHLSIHNGNSNPINLEFVPCENIIEVERVKELKRTKWLWNSKHKATAYMDVIG